MAPMVAIPTTMRATATRRPLRGELVGLHSARRGDYRVVYEVVDNTTVGIVHIGRRSDVYRSGH